MSQFMMEYRFKLWAITPLHVGTGQELPPSDYVIRAGILYQLDHAAFFARQDSEAREEYLSLVDRGDYVGLQVFMARNATQPLKYGWMRSKVEPSLGKRYAENLGRREAGMIIHPLARSGDRQRPLIPGSSIKGAMRTALLNGLLDFRVKRGVATRRKVDGRKARKFEADLLGFRDRPFSFDLDPLGGLKLADLEVPDPHGERVWLMEVKNLIPETGEGKAGFNLAYEVLLGEQQPWELRLALWASNRHRPGLNLGELLEHCNSFYLRKLQQEREQFYANGKHQRADSYCEVVEKEAANIERGRGCLLRVGRFSHREYLTLSGVGEGAGKTRNLLRGETPMGWVILELAA